MPEWGWPIVITAFLALVAVIYNHMERRLQRLEEWRVKDMAAIPTRVSAAEVDLAGLHNWKHEKIDPYVPPEVTTLRNDVNRLIGKVFG
jgi:hypothetical protein